MKSFAPGLNAGLLCMMGAVMPQTVLAADTLADGGREGVIALLVFVAAILLVVTEELTHLKKSKPVIVAAGLIWLLASIVYMENGMQAELEILFEHNLLEFTELFLFLLAAMTYVNTMQERGVFAVIRSWLVTHGLSLRQIFWFTGTIAFCLSPVADNLTTALLMATVISTVAEKGDNRFVVVSSINIVIAANAGGAFSPFGDITTLMVWQHGALQFSEFFRLVIPSLVNWLLPAAILATRVDTRVPRVEVDEARLEKGAGVVIVLFVITIVMAVFAHNYLHLPPVLGMMTGLGFLKLYGYMLQQQGVGKVLARNSAGSETLPDSTSQGKRPYDIYRNLEKAEWDTLMFFYGIILCVGGLAAFGYIATVSRWLYGDLGDTTANILVGFASAVVDNIPVMFAVLEMDPDMSQGQWLLVTLTAGVGGSMLAIGSAAGVAVLGQSKGRYTFLSHLKWSWVVLLGYAASILLHFAVNAETFT
jgi:Na+/H+ antiporter NhaD/arsenite permease-like protein